MTDFIVGIEYHLRETDIELWANSIAKSGFAGQTILFSYKASDKLKKLAQKYQVRLKETFPIEQSRLTRERWGLYANFLGSNEINSKDRVIVTDVRDLYFQRNPSTWLNLFLNGRNLVASLEGEIYESEPWNQANAIAVHGQTFYEQHLKRMPIVCAGFLAGQATAMTELATFAYQHGKRLPGPCDQSIINALLRVPPMAWNILYTDNSHAWAIHGAIIAASNQTPEIALSRQNLLPQIISGKLCNKAGVPYIAVHQYDRVAVWQEYAQQMRDDKNNTRPDCNSQRP